MLLQTVGQLSGCFVLQKYKHSNYRVFIKMKWIFIKAYLNKGYSIVAFSDHELMIPHNELSDENFLAITSTPESFAAINSTPVPTNGASVLIKGIA